MVKPKYTREHPEAPEEEPPDCYWFRFEEDDWDTVLEVSPGRKWWPKGWWGPKIPRLTCELPKDLPKPRPKTKVAKRKKKE